MMTKPKNFSLFFAGFASILSFTCLLIALNIPQKSKEPEVLGVTAPPISNNLVPCSIIESWQKQYCSTTNISPVPSKYIIPTPITNCTPSASLVANNIVCKTNTALISFSTYRCQNGSFIRVGDSTGVKCYDQKTLYQQAFNKCASFCTPNNPTPTIIKITPTRAPTPTFAPTVTPTISSNIPVIERAYPTTGRINEFICFYGSNFVGQITYPITTQPKIEFFYQGTLLLSEGLGQVNQHGKWEDKQVCTTITNPVFSGKGISVTITNYSQNKGNYYYYFD